MNLPPLSLFLIVLGLILLGFAAHELIIWFRLRKEYKKEKIRLSDIYREIWKNNWNPQIVSEDDDSVFLHIGRFNLIYTHSKSLSFSHIELLGNKEKSYILHFQTNKLTLCEQIKPSIFFKENNVIEAKDMAPEEIQVAQDLLRNVQEIRFF